MEDKRFNTIRDLKKHVNEHEGGESFHCPDCDLVFVNKAEMEAHERVHTEEEPFRCSICGKEFEEIKIKDKIYKTQNNYCSAQIMKAVREFRGENITESNTTKETYRAIKSIMRPEEMAKNKLKIENEGNKVEDPKDLAELFNFFFPEKVKKLAASIKKHEGIEPLEKLREKMKDLNLNFELKEVEEKDVMRILKKLKNKSSTGLDGISAEVMKMGAEVLCVPLTLIINVSIVSGQFPTAWKESKCVPLFKKGDRRQKENYRPVSLLSVSGMVLEKIVADQIEDFFERNKLFGSFQFGFRKKKSTVSELLQLFDSILEAKDNRREILLLMYDLSAAFDTVSHKTLIDKLTIYGFNPHSITWMKSYLEDRKQLVEIQGKRSGTQVMPTGTPQGSRISPLLFICLMADLDLWTQDCVISKFADDTQTLCAADNKDDIVTKTKQDAPNVINFFSANNLVNNGDKACVILRRTRNLLRVPLTQAR